jgi:hypothetical protein
MGHSFMEPSDYHDTPIKKVLRFIRCVGLAEEETKRSTMGLGGRSLMAS